MTYDEYINSEEWQIKAQEAKKRSGYHCQVCNSPNNLEVHHRTYVRLGSELPSDLTVLCQTCHDLFTRSNRMTSWLLDPVPHKPISFERLLELELSR